MSDVAEVVRAKMRRRRGIVVVDADASIRESVLGRLESEFGYEYEIRAVEDLDGASYLLTSLVEEDGFEVPVVVTAVRQARDEGLARTVVGRVDPEPTIVAYGDVPSLARSANVLQAAGVSYVATKDLEAAVYGALLERDLGNLSAASSIAADVLDAVNMNLFVLNPQMEVLWGNGRGESTVPRGRRSVETCWKRCFGFCYREIPCPQCGVSTLLNASQNQLEGGLRAAAKSPASYCLLPIHGKIERVELNGSPLLSRDGKRVLAVTQTHRLVTDEWEKTTPAHQRLCGVIAAARQLGQHRNGASSFVAVSVYYQPDKDADFHLFDAATDSRDEVPKVLRLSKCANAYRDAIEDRQPQFYEESARGQVRRHFLWADRTASMDRWVLVDVTYVDVKPDQLLTEDLAAYWQYVVDNFDRAWETRETSLEAQINSAIQEFLARTGIGIRGEAGLDSALEATIECVKKAVRPFSMHVRVLDRRSGRLVKRCGFGPYFELAPRERVLENDGIGSSWAASQRKPVWNHRADLDYIRRCLGPELGAEDREKIERIASDALVPLVCMDRVLGTLCMQFDDDSLYSPAQCSFVEALSRALGVALGTREWAHEREEIVECSRDLDRTMFRRSERPDEEEIGVLTQVTRMTFELSAAEVVAYYRYSSQTRVMTLVAEATQGALPPGLALPEVLPPDVGIVSQAAASRQGILVRNYREEQWQGTRCRLLAAFPDGRPNRFCRWVGSEIAEPVIAADAVKGVLVALSSIPDWLGADDVEVVREFARKTGWCLEAKYLTRQLNWNLRTKASLTEITAAMARVSDIGAGHRLLLLAITADECLGFSRGILFLRQEGDRDVFVASEVVGACSQAVAESRWNEAKRLPLAEKMALCARPPQVRDGDLQQVMSQLVLDLREQPEVRGSFQTPRMTIRRFAQAHPLHDCQLRRTLYRDQPDIEYALVPLFMGGQVAGAVLTDRAFLVPTDISPERLDLLRFLTGEFALMLEAIRLRREEEETQTAFTITRGVNYSLRTRAAALEGRVANLAYELGDAHRESIEGLKRGILFFKRVGTIAAKLIESRKIRPQEAEIIDVNAVVADVCRDLEDPRIALRLADCSVRVQAARHYLADVFWEILWNACEFADHQTGKIEVTVGVEGRMVRVDCIDNGPGIFPELRPNLFKPFHCSPAPRMGLGLSYVLGLVERYGGTIEEIGQWGRGAHFVVRIPLAEGGA